MKILASDIKIINDSRGQKTLEANLNLDSIQASASVPSGKSKGLSEAFVLESELAIKKLEENKSKIEKDFNSLEEFDKFLIELDGTLNKQNLGGNLILALSMAFTKAWAKLQNLQTFQLISQIAKQETRLPLCFFNLIEGGVHAHPPAGGLPFQEYLLIPQTRSARESLAAVTKAIKLLEEKIRHQYGQIRQGDEGGYCIPSQDPAAGLEVLQELIDQNGLKSKIGLDVAASTFFENGSYNVGGKIMSRDDLLSYYQLLTTNYQLLSIEDPFDEEDWDGFRMIMKALGNSVWIVGDDLTATNVERIKLAEEKNAINAVIIKPNQIGSVTEAIQAANLAKSYGWKIIVSHRSGETMDTFIADLAVGLGVDGLKAGCPLQRERLVKYQRLAEIESILNP